MHPMKAVISEPLPSNDESDDRSTLRRAVLFVHGIGLQQRFEEMTRFVNGLLDCQALEKFRKEETSRNGKRKRPKLLSRELKEKFLDKKGLGSELFQHKGVKLGKDEQVSLDVGTYKEADHFDARIQIKVPLESEDHTELALDIYEIYWAPLTAGKINILGVLAWIMETAPRLFRAAPKLKKEIFWKKFWLEIMRFIVVIAATLLVLLIAWWIGFLIYGLLKMDPDFLVRKIVPDWLPDRWQNWLQNWLTICIENHAGFWRDFTYKHLVAVVAGFILTCTLAYDLVTFTLLSNKIRALRILVTVGFYVLVLYVTGLYGLVPTLIIFLLTLMAYLSLQRFLVGYLGDVAVYASNNEVRKDFRVRTEIIRRARERLDFLLGIDKESINGEESAGNQNDVETRLAPYHDIVIISHSLGSVIAYDALNKTLFNEKTWQSDLARDRIRHLFTVGSPLEKIWFYFRDRGNRGNPMYQGILTDLKGFKNPGNKDSQFYNIDWTNIWSFFDVISSRLDRYGDGVVNYHDLSNSIKKFPLLNHLKYWQSSETMKLIGDRVFSGKVHG